MSGNLNSAPTPRQGYRFSPRQRILWPRQERCAAYRAQCAVLIEGKTQPETLKRAAQQVVARHGILRTTYRRPAGLKLPLQVISEAAPFEWRLTERKDSLPEASRVFALLQSEIHPFFDFENGPLLRLNLLQMSGEKHLLLITLPALCADARSLRNLVHELVHFYSAGKNDLAPVPMQYADYSEWHNAFLEGEKSEAGRTFWSHLNFSTITTTTLPLEKPCEEDAVFTAEVFTTTIGFDRAARIKDLARTQGISISDFLLAGWQVLLARLSGESSFIIGLTQEGRQYAEMEGALGLFAHTLPLETHLPENLRFSEILQQVKQAVRKAAEWQDCFSWEQVVLPGKGAITAPYCFEYQECSAKLSAGDVTFTIVQETAHLDRFKLKLTCAERNDSLDAEFHFDSQVYLMESIQRLSSQFLTLLDSALQSPEAEWPALEILGAQEKQRVLIDFNKTQVPVQQNLCAHQLIEEHAELTPDHPVVICGDSQLTFRELNSQANQLAWYLRALGVGRETLVAICIERSVDMAVGILAILKAGGAWVPMDPAYPKDRLSYMLETAQVPVLVTLSHLESHLPAQNATVVRLDVDQQKIAQQSTENPVCQNVPSDLAYVIYTSGSTGKPKGVMITHANLTNYVQTMPGPLGIKPADRYLHTASISFSSSVRQLMVPLSQGATVVVVTPDQIRDPIALFNEIKRQRVTVIDIVPSYWRSCTQALAGLQTKNRSELLDNHLETILSASEPLLSDLPENWTFGFQHNARMINMFGQTETTGIVSTYAIQAKQGGWPKVVSIGKPIGNLQIYLLDKRMRPVPIGVPGELYIAGAGVGRGYLNQPEVTAEKFVPHPFSNHPGDRLYRSGDLACYLPDGTLEFLGRGDNQVKISGYRIEPGEIEVVLGQHLAVRESVVVAREESPGEKRLVAYIGVKGKSAPTAGELRNFLREKLPAYMVPASFVILPHLPRLPNGKVNRPALPAPLRERPEIGRPYVAPTSETEKQLAEMWAGLLQLEEVGIDDNFFDLGGQSLLGTQVLSRVRETFQVEIPWNAFFEARVISKLAEIIEIKKREKGSPLALPLKPIPRENAFPLSFVQQQLWFLEQLMPGGYAYNLPVAVRLQRPLDISALLSSVQEIVRRHEALRTTFCVDNGNPLQIISKSQCLSLPLTDLGETPASDREASAHRLIAELVRKPFDLTSGPLLRMNLLRLDPQDHILLFVLHHTIFDGWSIGLLFRELEMLYSAFSIGKTPILPHLPIQYADFTIWQHQWLDAPSSTEQLSYWKKKLAGAPSRIDLPTNSQTKKASLQGAHQTVALPKSRTDELFAFSREHGVTPFMTMLAALAIVLNKWTTQSDLVIGTVAAGRTRREIEDLIGCFMNFLPLRIKVPGQESGLEFLGDVNATILEAYTNQDYPFEKIVESINPSREIDRNPLFNVAFLLQNYPHATLKMDPLTATPISVNTDAALLDLRFVAEEKDGEMSLKCEYRVDMFDSRTIELFLTSFSHVLADLLRRPHVSLSEFELCDELLSQAKAARLEGRRNTICIASTFTAEPVSESVAFWMNELGLSTKIEFSPYNQVFQQLLDSKSLLATNPHGINILLIRFEDWERLTDWKGLTIAEVNIRKTLQELVQALKFATGQTTTPYLLCVCPESRMVTQNNEIVDLYRRLETWLVHEIEYLRGVYIVTPGEFASLYPVSDYYDPDANELGHIPYTPLFFTSLGTMIARKYHVLTQSPYKVIVLDCDQTLWEGVCGEDGPRGIKVTEPFKELQDFMQTQHDAGVLLCICSKNVEEDVAEVFNLRQEMPLKRNHFAAWRVNWKSKSENLRTLSEELKLGLDSFIFLDDSPIECAEVQANCPEVLTLQLPDEPRLIPQFLNHVWAFDHQKLTEEDRQRTALYVQNRQREQFHIESLNMSDFLTGLRMEIQICDLATNQIPRVAQLTQRTNQFNVTTRRHTEKEIEKIWRDGRHGVFTVSVQDRFGDYGIVGIIIYEPFDDAIIVDTFLLSCRALGKGVEHRMLAHLGLLARSRGMARVEIPFLPTVKNRPALDFLESIGTSFRRSENDGFMFHVPTEAAAAIEYHPRQQGSSSNQDQAIPRPSEETVELRPAGKPAFSKYRWIALEAHDPASVLNIIESKIRSRTEKQAYAPPRTEVEKQISEVWEKILRIERVGIHDNFFDLGGHSLLATQAISRLRQAFHLDLPLMSLFEAPTPALMANYMETLRWTERSKSSTLKGQGILREEGAL